MTERKAGAKTQTALRFDPLSNSDAAACLPPGVLALVRSYLSPRLCEGTRVETFALGFRPTAIALSPDGETLHVAAHGQPLVASFRTSDYQRVGSWRPPSPDPSNADMNVRALALCADGSVVLLWSAGFAAMGSKANSYMRRYAEIGAETHSGHWKA